MLLRRGLLVPCIRVSLCNEGVGGPDFANTNEILEKTNEVLVELLQQSKQTHELLDLFIRAIHFNIDRITRRVMDSFHRSLLTDPRYADPRRLEHYAYRVFSDGGEDGTIQEIFHRIGTVNRRFVEFGVSAGNENNTHYLLHLGWTGLWIEANDACIRPIHSIFETAMTSGALTVRHNLATAENINDIIGGAGFTDEIDLLSVDIDGNDWHVAKAIRAINPRVIVIEYNATYPPPVEWIMPYDYPKRGGSCFGASLAAMAMMFGAKGYELVGTDIFGVNAFFVRQDLVGDRFTQVGDVGALYNPPRYGMGAAYPTGHHAPPFFTPSFQPSDDR